MDEDLPGASGLGGRPSGMRCLEHGLVTGADGRCVLCRRARSLDGAAEPVPAVEADAVAPAAIDSSRAALKNRLPLLVGAGLAVLVVVAALAYAFRSSDEAPVAVLTPTTIVGPAASLEATSVAAASQRVNVRAYTTKWCSACASARAWMRQERIRFVEYDVDSSRSAERRLRELNPRGTIPTIEIDRQVLVGFSPERLKQAILTAAANAPRR